MPPHEMFSVNCQALNMTGDVLYQLSKLLFLCLNYFQFCSNFVAIYQKCYEFLIKILIKKMLTLAFYLSDEIM